jgi:hypothetical protein
MATIVTDPYSQIADSIEAAILVEFDDLPYLSVRHDRIHESLGADGITYVGISPDAENANGIEQTTDVLIQFYGPWVADVNPEDQADPRVVTNYAERLRKALGGGRALGTSEVWYFTINSTRYPSDPTGNKTRFEMTITGRGDNIALLETFG